MLLRRVLDENGSDSDGLYGTRVFAFLENLDLVNRLYRQLLNAEGRNPFGTPDQKGHVLASLRVPEYAERYAPIGDEAEWDRDGQYWWLPEKLGFGTRSLQISRTSSQDTGVDQFTDIVVATSSLEVGYDDPRVGAILQHKAPRDIAQFLQRRGRAGRRQEQRPWTVVVFSDYGRDRLAFQSYESILDPSVPAKSLPLGNQSVRKMQAAMCLIDWIAARLGADGPQRWSARRIFARPDGEPRADPGVPAPAGRSPRRRRCPARPDRVCPVQSRPQPGRSPERLLGVPALAHARGRTDRLPPAEQRMVDCAVARRDPGHGRHRAATATGVHPVDLVQRSRAAGSGSHAACRLRPGSRYLPARWDGPQRTRPGQGDPPLGGSEGQGPVDRGARIGSAGP